MLLTELLESRLTDERGKPIGRVVEITSSGRPRDGRPERARVESLLYRPPGLTRRFEAWKTLAWSTVRKCTPGRIVVGRS